MEIYWLILGALATWRVTHLLNAEDGPADLLVRLRKLIGAGLPGRLLDCFLCLSIWIAAIFAYIVGDTWPERLMLWPALSAAAIILERLTARPDHAPPAVYQEDPERSYEEHPERKEEP